MALRQYENDFYEQSTVRIPESPEPKRKQAPQPKKKKKRLKLGDYIIVVCLALAFVSLASIALQKQADVASLNKENHKISMDIEKIEKENEELMIQVGEKSTYERIWQTAKERGLNLNEGDVKVVPGR